jgi:hypothetical protein
MHDPQPHPAPQPAPPPYVYTASPPYNGFAIASFVLGLVWGFWAGSVLAVIFGHLALNDINRTHKSGRGLAVAGLVLGYIGVGTLALVILLAIIGAAGGGQ